MRSHPLTQPTTPKNKTTTNLADLTGLPFLLLCSLKADAKILDNKHSFLPIELTMTTISLEIDTDVAKAFQLSEPEQQQKIQRLINGWMKQAINISKLQTTMDKLSDEAEANGLTPEILESILNE